ncbi:MAG: hypothetical protein HEEMFOPI_00558 [Holosporales bacterium]
MNKIVICFSGLLLSSAFASSPSAIPAIPQQPQMQAPMPAQMQNVPSPSALAPGAVAQMPVVPGTPETQNQQGAHEEPEKGTRVIGITEDGKKVYALKPKTGKERKNYPKKPRKHQG